MTLPETLPHPDDELDSCSCGLQLTAAELTSDLDLPTAVGGVEQQAATVQDDDEHEDCCGAAPAAFDVTTDEELPQAVGGM